MTKPKKTPSQMADEHWAFEERLILECMKVTMFVAKANFAHGFKHGKEDHIGIRTRPTKK